MSVSLLKTRSRQIAKNAFTGTFVDSRDENKVIDAFADVWSQKFSVAVQKYIGMCIGLPTGGPVVPAPITTLQQDIYDAAKSALKATYLSNDYTNQVENVFAQNISQVASIISSYMGTVATIPAAPPVVPVSPGGPLIASSSSMCTPIFRTTGQAALLATFAEGDVGGVATRFANIWQQHGLLIGEYVMTCSSLPGGGPLVAS